jgi:hypothetical protein
MKPNGERYPLVGGTRQRHFDGTNLKPRKVPENAPTPTSRVHALLGGFSLLCSITEENCAISKAALLQKLELQSHVVGQGWFAASHYDR